MNFVGFQKDLTQLEEQVMRKRCKLSAVYCLLQHKEEEEEEDIQLLRIKEIHGIVQPMAESRLKKKLMHAIFGASIHLKCRQSLEVVFNNLMNWRIYSSDEGTLQQSMKYLYAESAFKKKFMNAL
ncbi:hypothetical protein Prudu_001341 [Prunus dulcis]|uniref:Uncharacterized protein n=1 Tax=Prunus dulcis TaxID=3755 RepID=A0A4Y1QNI3_PRUDU|nr:hypothetical protein Prudu_001341 [Prunus dulcis]